MFTSSCVEINGNLQVFESFNVKKKSGFLNLKTREVQVDPRNYKASIKFVSDKKFNLHLDGGSHKNISIPVKAEGRLDIPDNGRFNISHDETDQPFDISGIINTHREMTGYNQETVICSQDVTERKCEKVCDREIGSCDVVCRDVTMTINGRKNVQFHYLLVHRQLSLEIMKENSTGVVAAFVGSDTESTKIIDHESACW